MDQSFDQFGGGGWGEQGEGEQLEYSGFQHQKSIYDKVPMQVEIEDLLKMSSEEENFVIGKYSFNTIRIVGKIVNIHNDPNQSTSTYEVCDALAKDPRTAKRLTVIVMNAEDNPRISSKPSFSEGQTIHIMGKIRAYNNRVSLLSIHIRHVAMDEIELFKMECKLAKHFYQKNLPERPIQSLENSIYKIVPPQQQQARPGTGTGKPMSTPSRSGYSNAPTTPSKSNTRIQAQTPTTTNKIAQQMPQHLTTQQRKIYGFIIQYSQSNSGGSGVHVEQIRTSIKPNEDFRDDLQFLQNDGKIYTTVDDDHFSIVE